MTFMLAMLTIFLLAFCALSVGLWFWAPLWVAITATPFGVISGAFGLSIVYFSVFE